MCSSTAVFCDLIVQNLSEDMRLKSSSYYSSEKLTSLYHICVTVNLEKASVIDYLF